MKYCRTCVLPDTRPNLVIQEDGICNACHSFQLKPHVAREKEFISIVNDVRSKRCNWDCVIPVSGGKDSIWQVMTALEYGLKPLCVTWKTPARTPLGQKNLDSLIKLGVDHIDFTINPRVEKKLTLQTLKNKGSVAIPMHLAIFAIPLQIAINFKVPLVLWGENSAVEYGGGNCLGAQMSREWLLAYGVTQGTTAEDWITENLTLKDLAAYMWPSDEELQNADVKAIFLGHYFNWDPDHSYQVAKRCGFEALSGGAITGIYDYADVDDSFLIPIHHWLKWYKFGFTRVWDNLSLEIRNGRLSREEALKKLESIGSLEPTEAFIEFCNWADISLNDFYEIIEKFRNHNIWYRSNNSWKIKDFIFDNWNWKQK